MKIGNKIKELRKQRKITQEQLANGIGISSQAVSKWENGIALPDITLAPVLARYFGITLDELFGFGIGDMESEIEAVVSEASKYIESDPKKGREIIEKALIKYPDNEVLLCRLLYLVTHPDETISIASKLIDRTDKAEIKYDALRFLAYAYKAKGEIKSAERAIAQIPEINFTRLTEAAYLFEGKTKFNAANKQKWVSFENLIQMMEKIAEYYDAEGNGAEAEKERKKAIELISLMDNKDYVNYVTYFKKKIK